LVFLGDYVGYGADPGYVVDTVMREVEAGAVALLGNHDAAIGSGPGGMNSIAAEAIEWTRPRLNSAQREFLARLPLTFEDDSRLFVHASAHAPAHWEYVTDVPAASRSFMATQAHATFCGHVHVPELFHLSSTGKIAGFQPVQAVEIPLFANRRWLTVLGSVGQPRDFNPTACYGALDVERNVLTYVRVPYDNETAAQKVREAGLPAILSDRLIVGA
jgi:diadenosine tetraphosphatase ApaH/serine/threonine PP2A family protein phosphatase